MDNRLSPKAISYIGICVALIAVSAWITIPIGPIPLTLQMFAIPLIICILPGRWAFITVCIYLLLGLIGVPVFSNFGSGIAKFLGPTGGYLIGYVPGTFLAAMISSWAVREFPNNKSMIFAFQIVAGLVFTCIAYLTGWIQYSAVAHITLEQSFFVSVMPFILPDVIKVIAAVSCAQAVSAAVRLRTPAS